AGKASPAEGLVSPANATWHNPSIKKYTYDQTGALTALGDAFHVIEREGKPQLVDVVNRPVKLNLYYPKTPQGEGIQKIIAGRMMKAGVPVKPVAVEPGKLLSQY